MEASFTYEPSTVDAAQAWVLAQSASWGIRSPYLREWVQRGGELLGPGRSGDAVLAWDETHRLLSLDVWCDGRRVYGMDDLL